jgi:hypothetical protein
MIEAASTVRHFPIAGGLALFETRSRRLSLYNEAARVAWELLPAAADETALATAFARHWRIPDERAQADLGPLLAQWRAQGLIAGHAPAVAETTAAPPRADVSSPASSSAPSRWICTIRGVPIAFAVAGERAAQARTMTAHLTTPEAAPRVTIEIVAADGNDFVLRRDGIELARTDDPALMIGGLWQMVLESIYPEQRWLALMHGAALARGGQGVALAAPSGSGKSTLAAGLLRAGFDFLTDDLVPLAARAGAIVPWPMPLSIKPGSTEVVSRHFPQLADAPPYPTKGTEARLLLPPAEAWEQPPVPLKRLVFPQFGTGSAAECRPLPPFEALQRLIDDRVFLGSPLEEERLAAFVRLIDATPAFAIRYGTLDDGVRLTEEIMR